MELVLPGILRPVAFARRSQTAKGTFATGIGVSGWLLNNWGNIMNDQNSSQASVSSDKQKKSWLADTLLLLLGVGSFSGWFFMMTMLSWVVIVAITNRSELAVQEQSLRQILSALGYSMRVFGTKEPTPAVLTHCINLLVFAFNMVIGWRWIRRKQTGRFALLLLSESFIIIFILLSLALHIAASPYTATRGSWGFF